MLGKDTLDYTSHGNDLFADFKCECPSKSFEGSPIAHLMNQKITLSGYNDNYFFDVVNKEPRIYKCKCGREYSYQWKFSGVEIESLPYKEAESNGSSTTP